MRKIAAAKVIASRLPADQAGHSSRDHACITSSKCRPITVKASQPRSKERVMEAAPVEYMIVAFPGNRFRGEIAPALKELVDSGTIKIIDLTFVGKDEDGSVVTFEVADLDPDVQEALESLGAEVSGLFNEEDLMAAAEELEPNTSAALLVWEDLWAGRLAQALRDAGGELLDLGRVPHEVVQAARDWAAANS